MLQKIILVAFLLLITGNLFATFADVLVKILGNADSLYQYLLFRQGVLMILVTPLFLYQPPQKRHPGNIKVHISRGVLANIGGAATVVALLHLPLATANVLFYAGPIFTMLIAAWLLKEPIKQHRILAMILGFIGIALAMRPEYINWAGAAALITALCVALFNLSVRWLPDQTSTISTLFWTNVCAMPITACLALFNWQPVSHDLILLSVGACLCLLIYQGSCIIAFKKADAGAVAIAEYSGLVFAGLLGWFIFGEYLDRWTLLGMALIILPIAWQSAKEHRDHQSKTRGNNAETLADTSPPHPNFIAQTNLTSDDK